MKKRGLFSILGVLILVATMPPLVSAQNQGDESCATWFYSPSCPHCQNVKTFLQSTNQTLDLRGYRAADHAELFNDYADAYGVPASRRGAVPTAFIRGDYYIGDEPIITALKNLSEDEELGRCQALTAMNSTTNNPGLLSVSGLALVDAVNPCALAVLIILLTSILSQNPKAKHRVLRSGLAFSSAIFAAYFGLGLLITAGYKAMLDVVSSQGWLYTGLGVFAVILGLFNIKDWLSLGSLGFVMEVPRSWRSTMKAVLRWATSPRWSFGVGVVVSLFLLPCTAGPYFVAGGLLSGMSFGDAAVYLAFYNGVFILPMLAMTGAVWSGLATLEDLSDWRDANIERLHLVAGLILLFLGASILFGV